MLETRCCAPAPPLWTPQRWRGLRSRRSSAPWWRWCVNWSVWDWVLPRWGCRSGSSCWNILTAWWRRARWRQSKPAVCRSNLWGSSSTRSSGFWTHGPRVFRKAVRALSGSPLWFLGSCLWKCLVRLLFWYNRLYSKSGSRATDGTVLGPLYHAQTRLPPKVQIQGLVWVTFLHASAWSDVSFGCLYGFLLHRS